MAPTRVDEKSREAEKSKKFKVVSAILVVVVVAAAELLAANAQKVAGRLPKVVEL